MRRTSLIVVSALAALPAATALAQPPIGPQAGDREVTLAGTGANDKDFDNGSIGVSGSFGQYITDTWQWSIRQSLNWAQIDDADDAWNGSTRLALDYNFMPGNRLRPFVGANVGFIYGDGVDDTGIAAPEIGLKYYIKPETFLYAQTEYQFTFEDADEVDDQFDDGSWAHTVGFGINF